jgi:hypothetical protein
LIGKERRVWKFWRELEARERLVSKKRVHRWSGEVKLLILSLFFLSPFLFNLKKWVNCLWWVLL